QMENLKNEDGLIPDDPSLSAFFNTLDTKFHTSIARASKNQKLYNATVETRAEIFYPVGALFNRLRPDADYLHSEIVAAIKDRDPAKAATMMTEHIKSTRKHFEDSISNQKATVPVRSGVVDTSYESAK